jgi:hypothetical protein
MIRKIPKSPHLIPGPLSGIISKKRYLKGDSVMADCESVLSIIEEDMKIYDIKNVKVGTVEFIHFSEASGASNSDVATPSDKPIQPALVDGQ